MTRFVYLTLGICQALYNVYQRYDQPFSIWLYNNPFGFSSWLTTLFDQ